MKHSLKLGLGTVQWGMPYGIANRAGQATMVEVEKVIRVAKRHGITLLDTAHAYGEAERVLGEQRVVSKGFRVVTKTLPLESSDINPQDVASVSAAFLESLRRLNCTKVYGLLIHHGGNLLVAGGDRLWAILQDFKARNLVEKIGVSVYHPQEIRTILDRFQIDLVQLPFNLYDQRFKQTNLLDSLARAGIEVHARSIFLQGLLLLPADQLPEHFRSIRDHHARLHYSIREAGLTPLEVCLQFCFDQTGIDQIIVGCESVEQLGEILAATRKEDVPLSAPELYSISDELIINPARWAK